MFRQKTFDEVYTIYRDYYPSKFELGKRLVEYRERAKLTQGDVATILGCKRQVISNWERGVNDIPATRLIKLLNIYGIKKVKL